MTAEEAKQIYERLCLTFRHYPRDEKDAAAQQREAELWIQHLMPVPFHLADEAVWQIARSAKYRYMPRIPEFIAYIDEIHNQGTANALGAIGPAGPHVTEFERWRSEQIVAMTDEEYWLYLYDEDWRRQKERQWEQEWQTKGGRMAVVSNAGHVRHGKNGGGEA